MDQEEGDNQPVPKFPKVTLEQVQKLAVFIAGGAVKHCLWRTFGSFSPARCGVSPVWHDPKGWQGSVYPGGRAKLEKLRWCKSCVRSLHSEGFTQEELDGLRWR